MLLTDFPDDLESRLQEIRQAREELIRAAETAPNDDELTGKNPDRWSIAEIIFHLYIAEKRTTKGLKLSLEAPARSAPADEALLRTEWERVRTLVGQRGAKVKAPERVVPTGAPHRSEAIRLLRQSREELLNVIRHVPYSDLLSISMPHPLAAVGTLTGAGWLSMTAFHDLRHAQQIREMQASRAAG